MIEYLSFTKNLNKRKTSYILSLLKRIDFRIVIQSDLDYLMSQLQKLKVSVDELKTLKKIMDNFLVSDEVIYGDNSLPYKIFCYNMATRFYSYKQIALSRNTLPDFFDDLVLDIDTGYNVMYIQHFMSTPSSVTAYNAWQMPTNNQGYAQAAPSTFQMPIPPQYSASQPPIPPNLDGLDSTFQTTNFNELANKEPENRFEPIYNEFNTSLFLESKMGFYSTTKENYISTRSTMVALDWLKINNEEQLNWAVEYLNKANLIVYPRLFLPKSNQDIYDSIVVCITCMGFYSPMTFSKINVDNFIKKMRQAWYQKRYRDNKDGETALQYLLSKSYLKKLDKLAEEYGVPPLEMLQNLITQEYDRK